MAAGVGIGGGVTSDRRGAGAVGVRAGRYSLDEPRNLADELPVRKRSSRQLECRRSNLWPKGRFRPRVSTQNVTTQRTLGNSGWLCWCTACCAGDRTTSTGARPPTRRAPAGASWPTSRRPRGTSNSSCFPLPLRRPTPSPFPHSRRDVSHINTRPLRRGCFSVKRAVSEPFGPAWEIRWCVRLVRRRRW